MTGNAAMGEVGGVGLRGGDCEITGINFTFLGGEFLILEVAQGNLRFFSLNKLRGEVKGVSGRGGNNDEEGKWEIS